MSQPKVGCIYNVPCPLICIIIITIIIIIIVTRVAILGSSWEPIVQHKHQDLRAIQVGVVKLSTRRPVEQANCDADGKWFDFMFDSVWSCYCWWTTRKDISTFLQGSWHNDNGANIIPWEFLGHPLAGLRHGAVCLHIAGWCPQRLIGWYTVYRSCCSAGSLHYFCMFQTTSLHAICRILLKILEKRDLFPYAQPAICSTFFNSPGWALQGRLLAKAVLGVPSFPFCCLSGLGQTHLPPYWQLWWRSQWRGRKRLSCGWVREKAKL